MKHQLKINPSIWAQFPSYSAYIIYAEGLENKQSNEYSTSYLRAAEKKQRDFFGTEKPSTDSHIAAWREAYKDFGAKPSKYLCSAEALLGRSLKGQDLPIINYLVDLYNGISTNYLIPVGGEDWDYLSSDLTLTLATGNESFTTYQSGELIIEHPAPGEVIWVDSTGVTCRRWNWRQCHRTQLTVDTRNAYFVLDRLSPYPIEKLFCAGKELMELLKASSPNCVISYEVLQLE
jgi:DNA/RNA-binding domain of Phe-tRNA-synthetase-like protein